MTGGYRGRALAALKWSVSGDMAEQGIRLAFGVALARLLTPREFGLIAMVTAITQIVGTLAEMGLGDALVQRRELTEAHRSSVFWALLLTGGTLTAAQCVGASTIATLYGVRELIPIAATLSALFVLDAFGSVPRAVLARRLDFRIIARLQCAAAVVACSCAVALAWRGFGAMSLAADLLLTSALESLLLLGACGWRPQFEIRVAALRDLLAFGAHRVGARTLNLAASPIDRLLIGMFQGSGSLGLYVRAYNLTRLPVTNVSRSIVRALFPSMVLIQRDVARTRELYMRAIAAVALATFPMCLGLFAVADPLVVGVLGPHWRGAVPIVRILSAAGLVQSVSVLTNTVYLSQGRTDLQFRLAALERLCAIAAIAIGLRWGITGAATAYVLATLLTALPTLYCAGRLVQLPLRAVGAHLAPVLFASTLMTAVVLGVAAGVPVPAAPLERLALEVAAGALAYWGALRLFRVHAYRDVLSLLQRPV